MSQLGHFTLSDMVRASAALRQLGRGAGSIEEFAQRVVEFLREDLTARTTGEAETTLIRFYKTHAYEGLPAELQSFAQGLLGHETPAPAMKCLTLMATVGDEPAWCDRRASQGHRAVPLPSEEVVARLPMIAQLIRQFGLDASTVVRPDPDVLLELDEKTYNVFHVAQAAGSAHIPAQDFVAVHNVAAALGFGGMLPNGDLFAVVLFSRVAIPDETAELFKTLAVSVKVALLPLVDGPLFSSEGDDAAGFDGDLDLPDETRVRQLAVEQLLEVHERIVTDQAARLEEAWAIERRRSAQLRELASAAAVINSSMSLDEILARVTEQARLIVGAHQAVTSLTVGMDWAQAISTVSLSDKYDTWADYEALPSGEGIYAMVCETNRPIRLDQDELRSHPRWRGFGAHAAEHPPIRGWLAAPLVARDGTNLGIIQLSDKNDGGDFTAEDEAILVQLAQLASITVGNAQLYQREHEIAAELQRSLLPQDLPLLPGIEVAVRYFAGATGVDIGGDWYDVFPVGDRAFALVLGDVAGKGITAASVMGQLRMALRGFALQERSPADVVARLDQSVQQLGLVEFATLAYAVWTPDEGGLDLVLAGHPAPLVITPAGATSYAVAEPSPPLGAVPGATFAVTHLEVARGSTLLLYSDGLVEARDLALDAGFDRLRASVGSAPLDLEGLCDHLASKALSSDADDDVTLLAVRGLPS